MESETTIKKLFHEDGIQFFIPSYQRAYSWEYDKDRKQIKQFIADIKEQKDIQDQKPNKKYFLGHFLFERNSMNDNKYWVIDGQQRLTTVVIFFSCLIHELEKRESALGKKITDSNGDEIEIWRIREDYIKIGRNYKFSTVSYDNPFFENLILENDSTANVCDSSSKRRIYKAKEVFEDLFKSAELPDILTWKKIIDDADITTFKVTSKIQATQIFAFQNDRGKDLTTLEKLKAFLMHKLYVVVDEGNAGELIKNIEIEFSDIYRQAERISFDEDRVLNYHNVAYLSYTEDNPLTSVKSKLAKIKDNSKKENWIKEFVRTLKETFYHIELIENKYKFDNAIADVMLLDTNNAMPLLIKFYHYHHNDEKNIMELAMIVEKIIFKYTYKSAVYRTNNLPKVARDYKGEIKSLEAELKDYKKNGFQPWWEFNKNCKNYFIKNTWHFTSGMKYILWKYENYLRKENQARLISPEDFLNKFGKKRLENTIDHITPQNPNFTEHTEEFKTDYLNHIGNLVLMVWGDNSEKRNNNPVDEVDLYDSDYYSHKEIRDTLLAKRKWGEEEIEQRGKNIIDFIERNWEL
jgi:uncharacterized protein with ParB-like and HNH nuclease domain